MPDVPEEVPESEKPWTITLETTGSHNQQSRSKQGVFKALSFPSSREMSVHIDKSILRSGDVIERNLDGTIRMLRFDSGCFTVSSIAQVSDMSYASFFGVAWGQLAIVDFTGLNNRMMAEELQTGAVKNLSVSVNDTSGTGISLYDINLAKWLPGLIAQIDVKYSEKKK